MSHSATLNETAPDQRRRPLRESAELVMVRDAARALLDAEWPSQHAAALAMRPDEVRRLWQHAVRQGWSQLDLNDPELGLGAALVLQQELGRAECPLPLADALLADAVLAASSQQAATALRTALHEGDLVPTWCFGPESGEADAFDLNDHGPTLSARLRVRSIEEMMFTAALLEKTGVLQGEGVAVLSASGGMGELAADYAHLEGVGLPKLAPATLAALAAALPPMATPANPLDLTGAVVNQPGLFFDCMQALEQDPSVSVLVCVFDVPTDLNNDWAPFAVGSLQAIGRFKPQGRVRFLAISNTVKYVSDRSRAEIEAAGMPYLPSGLDVGMKALRQALRWSAQQREAATRAAAPPALVAAPASLPTSEAETMAYLAGAGVAVVPQVLAETEAIAVSAAAAMGGGAVVLKIASPDIAHKTEVGGVLLNLQGEQAVADGFRRIMASARQALPKARLQGVIVSPMRRGGVELFVGVRRDAQWGHVIALGLGGVWIEALQDVSLRVLPVSPEEVKRMVGELRGARLLDGFRGAAPVDLDELARLVARIGDAALALGDALDTLEVNPLLAEGDRIEALDALATYR